MSRITRIATPLIAVALMTGAPFIALAQNSQAAGNQTQNAATETQDWNTPPAGTEQAQTGFRDGILAAKLDKLAHRTIDAKASHLYVHPPVKGSDAVSTYRQSFQSGYDAAVKHGIEVVQAHPAS
ncbi:MAG TPA: hypothetical protein VGL72_14620 [Bryobacteraceae bacterium]